MTTMGSNGKIIINDVMVKNVALISQNRVTMVLRLSEQCENHCELKDSFQKMVALKRADFSSNLLLTV